MSAPSFPADHNLEDIVSADKDRGNSTEEKHQGISDKESHNRGDGTRFSVLCKTCEVRSCGSAGNDIFEVMVRLNLFYLAVLVLGLNIWTTNDNALYTAGLGLANIFHQKKKPMVLLSGIIGTVASVWLYYNFCGWLNILNCTLPPVGMILVLAYFMNKEDFETDQPKLKTIDWFAVAGVILGAIVANLLHWGIASINGMVVAALCYCVGQAVNKRK